MPRARIDVTQLARELGFDDARIVLTRAVWRATVEIEGDTVPYVARLWDLLMTAHAATKHGPPRESVAFQIMMVLKRQARFIAMKASYSAGALTIDLTQSDQ